jgi:hypothetical protein
MYTILKYLNQTSTGNDTLEAECVFTYGLIELKIGEDY